MFNKFIQAIVITLILGWIGSKDMMATTAPIAITNSSDSLVQIVGWNFLDLAL